MIENRATSEPDVILVGAGIMSATLGVFLKELEPALNISMVETLDGAAPESSDAWNNAGTGHAANCELNYTPERSDGSIDISKALDVNVEFDLSAVLVLPGNEARDRGSAIVHPSGPAHELCAWARQRRLPQEAVRSDERASLLSRHGIYGGQEEAKRVGPAGDGGPRRRRAGGRHADHHRRRRRLWIAHPQP